MYVKNATMLKRNLGSYLSGKTWVFVTFVARGLLRESPQLQTST
jgi:hypothetical protein|tara:strand:+ start:477 stop:608 length:132 start_codon:yes stop_codon:yes gene_type:complete